MSRRSLLQRWLLSELAVCRCSTVHQAPTASPTAPPTSTPTKVRACGQGAHERALIGEGGPSNARLMLAVLLSVCGCCLCVRLPPSGTHGFPHRHADEDAYGGEACGQGPHERA